MLPTANPGLFSAERCSHTSSAHVAPSAPLHSSAPQPEQTLRQPPLCRDDGVGLAAPQVGVNVRLMVFNETGQRGSRKEQVLSFFVI